MKAYQRAQAELRHALKNQKTITTKKLGKILNDMNISLKKDNDQLRRTFDRKAEVERQAAKKRKRQERAKLRSTNSAK